MRWLPIPIREGDFVRGLAILVIVLHNFLHRVPPSAGENEFFFDPVHFDRLLLALRSSPAEGLHLLFAALGFLPVHVFVFLSGYGLVRRYADRAAPGWGRFMLRRLGRIYPAFAMAAALHLGLCWLRAGSFPASELGRLGLRLSLLSNFVPGSQLMPVGPWWFFSVIVQLYALFPLLLRLGHLRPWALLALGLFCAPAAVWLGALGTGFNPMFTALGYLPAFSLGMLAARCEPFRLPLTWLGPLLGLVVLGQALEALWMPGLLAACLALLILFRGLRGRGEPGPLRRWIARLGAMSLPAFAVHAVIRPEFVALAGWAGHFAATLGLAAAFALASFGLAWLMDRLDFRVQRLSRGSAPPRDAGA
ncbi:MAG: acyltransferase [Deltaproteobacteria bacterium]|nr:acyltransferase [Deltaproteobacteria bacterium]